ncbi:uncharacterized protein LOC124157405 [Ischnura elegans]|uniref:uncharacterized protein LOC124157405 n=1 Tax=Ischnura elegans TaxID=197161 RepID=UPI001ED89B38|nr:uncharacterized protein LOC124157405 [Ischnura elegans]
MRRKRRGWTGAMSAARIHGCPDVVSTMWIVLVLLGALGGGGVECYPPWGAAPVPPEPVQVMTDVTNHLGVSLLQDFAYQPGNVAFSPYGAASVLVVVWEGARGESGEQLRRALGLPSSPHPTLDHGVVRLGMRDIHRHLRSYFAHDGYLNGLTFGNTTETSIKPSFRQILRFYGYDPDTAMSGGGTFGAGVEMATPPWMKKPANATTPSPGPTTTPNATEASAETKGEGEGKPNATSSAPTTTPKPSPTTPTPPPPTAPKPTAPAPTTAKPSKTTKSIKATTTPKPSTAATTKGTTAKPTTTKPAPKPTRKPTPPPQSTLQDFNAPPIAAFSDDSGSSTRVTRKMMTGEPDDAASPTLSVSIPTESSGEQASGMRTSLMPTLFSPLDYEDEVEPSSTLSSLNREKTTTTSGITTTFVLMMTTKKVQQFITDATTVSTFPMMGGAPQIPPSTSPITPGSTTSPIPPPPEKITLSEGISQVNLTASSTEMPSSTTSTTMAPPSSSSMGPSEEMEATTEMTLQDGETKEPTEEDTVSDDNVDMQTTTPEYDVSTTPMTEEIGEMSSTMSSDSDFTLPTPETGMEDEQTTTESTSDSGMMTTTEAMMAMEETTTMAPENDEASEAVETPKSRRRRSPENAEDHFPELQLHLHGNAMLNKDEQDLDKLWQNYQGQFGLPLAPFHVHQGQGFESGVKWVPMIRLVRLLPFAYSSRLQAQALMLPLDDERYKLLLVLPVGDLNNENGGWRALRRKRSYPFQHQNDHQDGLLLRLIDDLRSVPLREIVSSVQPCMVAATIPPFLIRGLLDLTPSLQRIGVKDVFDVKSADLSGMSNDTNMWVRGVEQTVSVAIDVNGLFGGQGAGSRSRPEEQVPPRDQQSWSQPQENPNNQGNLNKRNAPRYWGGPPEEPRVQGHFLATRPFLFFVVDTSTRVALMAGKVTDPLSTKNA